MRKKVVIFCNELGTIKNNNSASGPSIVAYNLFKALKKYSNLDFLFICKNFKIKESTNKIIKFNERYINKNFLNSFDFIHILSGKEEAIKISKLGFLCIIGTNVVFDICNPNNLSKQEKIKYKNIIDIENKICQTRWKYILVQHVDMIDIYLQKFKFNNKYDFKYFPCGIDTNIFYNLRKKFNQNNVIMWIGPGKKKGYDLFIKIKDILKNKFNFICKNHNYNYHEHIKDLEKTDIFLSLSRYETQGLATMEAMSCGIPVICAKFTSSLKPIFQNSVLLVERDTNKIIEKIEKISRDEKLYLKYHQKSLDFIKNFTLKKMSENYENILLGK